MNLSARSIAVAAVRYAVPALLCLAGVVVFALGSPALRLDALVVLIAAGLSTFLFNKLVRVGITGDLDRDDEEAARLFMDRYRMWPDEVPEGWVPPDGEPDAETALAHLVEQRSRSMVAA
jgi:hypothetical protein